MAFNMERWRVQSNNLYLPYNDLDLAGSAGRLLTIPDDVSLTLAYPVLQTALGFRTQKADIYGVTLTGGISVAFTLGYTLTQVINGNATLVITIPFRSAVQYIFNNGSAVRMTFTNNEVNMPQVTQLASLSGTTNSFSCQTVSVLNTTAAATTLTFTAVAP